MGRLYHGKTDKHNLGILDRITRPDLTVNLGKIEIFGPQGRQKK